MWIAIILICFWIFLLEIYFLDIYIRIQIIWWEIG